MKIDTRGRHEINFGRERIDLNGLEQLFDPSQTRAIGDIIHYYAQTYGGRRLTLREGLTRTMADVVREGLDLLSPYKLGDYAMPRIFEVAAAINRMRSLKIGGQKREGPGS